MKIKEVYKSIFNMLIKPEERVVKIEIDKNNIFISPSGYFGFVFDKRAIPFNLNIMTEVANKLNLQNITKEENRLILTDMLKQHKALGLLSVFEKNGENIYVNTKYLKFFEEHAIFFQESKLGLIAVVENGNIVGAIMPVRI